MHLRRTVPRIDQMDLGRSLQLVELITISTILGIRMVKPNQVVRQQAEQRCLGNPSFVTFKRGGTLE
jgi:hypothetical protein